MEQAKAITNPIHITPIHNRKELSNYQISMNANAHADRNEYLVGDRTTNVFKEIVEDITGKIYSDEEWDYIKDEPVSHLKYASGRKVRSDAIYAVGLDAYYPKRCNAAESIDKEDFNNWKNDTFSFIEKLVYKANIKLMVLHIEDEAPSIHTLIIPLIRNAKNEWSLCYKKLIADGPAQLQQLQVRYLSYIGFDPKKRSFYSKELTTNDILFCTGESALDELPIPEDGMSALEYRKMMQPMFEDLQKKNEEIELEAKQNRISGEQKEKLKELAKRVHELEQELSSRTNELNQYKLNETYEKTGMSIHPDQSMISGIYVPLKASLLEAGKAHVAARREDRESLS